MNSDERAVAAALRQISADAQPVHVPDDLWARGLRRHRLRLVAVVAGATALVALMAVPVEWVLRPHRVAPAEHQQAIPSRIRGPISLQPNLVDAPNGPASVIVTGPGGFGASDVLGGYDDRAIVVGRDGLYRYVRDINSVNAGEDLLLSPDGRYVAGRADLEGVVDWGESNADWQATAGVMDLTTGDVRTLHGGPPVAWSPDDRLLTRGSSGDLNLVDVGSGEAVSLDVGGALAVAFSPDGRQLALQSGRELMVLNVDTHAVRTVAELGARQTLAGPGAWSAGDQLAIWDSNECQTACPTGYAEFRLSLVAIGGGAVTDAGLDLVQAVSATLLGWRSDGDAVVVLTMTGQAPAGPHPGAPQVLALHPGGGRTALITVTADADRIDIARNLLDHFGGGSRSGWALFLDMVRVRLHQALPWLAVIAALIAARLAYRRIRHGVWPSLPRRDRNGRPHHGQRRN